MKKQSTCRKCGAPLTTQAREGVCPKCLLEQALAVQTGEESSETSLPPSPELTEGPGTIIGRYKLLEKIGEGGFGVVYMAEQEEPVRRRVALKIIKLGMDTKEVIARFEAERQALALMDHPNIAKVFDGGAVGADDPQSQIANRKSEIFLGRPYFVMELVRGIPITEYCDQKRLPPKQRLELFMQVCQAVQHAHQKGIIHRDLKPSNILVTVNDPASAGVPKVIDFGIAKATGMRLTDKTLFTRFLHLLGTPAYMSPEQVEMTSVDVDTRSDIYSLGVLLYELLTGQTPFDAKELLQVGVDEMRRRIREEEPPKPSTRLSMLTDAERTTAGQSRSVEGPKLLHLVRGDLDWIVMKCLEKERARRYDTASGLAADLHRYLNDEPVVAGPPTARYRAKKFVRKHRVAMAVAAGFVALLAVASIVSASLALWANRERREKDVQRLQAEARATAEFQAKEEADQQRIRAEDALSYLQIQQAQDVFAAGNASGALAHLAAVLRHDPSHSVAAQQLLFALTYRSFPLPTVQLEMDGSKIMGARFSPDGQWVVTAGPATNNPEAQLAVTGLTLANGTVASLRIWNARTGARASLDHDEPVRWLQFSPDGQRLITASAETNSTARQFCLWDIRTGQALAGPLLHGTNALLRFPQFGPDGQRLLTVSKDSVRLWDARTGRVITEPLSLGNNGAFLWAQFSPDGRRLLTVCSTFFRLWDGRTGLPATGPLGFEEQPARTSFYFSPNGGRLLTASSNSVQLWDALSGEPLTNLISPAQPGDNPWHNSRRRTFIPRLSQVLQGAPGGGQSTFEPSPFTSDGNLFVTISADGTARVWDARVGQPVTKPLVHDLNRPLWFARFSPDGKRLLTAGTNTVRLWDVQTGQPVTGPFIHGTAVRSAQFTPNGLRLVTDAADDTVRIWDVNTGVSLTGPLRGLRGVKYARNDFEGAWFMNASYNVTSPVLLSPDGERLLLVSRENSALLWDVSTGRPLTALPMRGAGFGWGQFSVNGQLALTHDDSSARLWDARTGRPLTEALSPLGYVQSVELSPEGQRVLAVPLNQVRDPFVRIWDMRPRQALAQTLNCRGHVFKARFSPDGERCLTVSRDIRLWDVRTGQGLSELPKEEKSVVAVQFSSDGQQVLAVLQDAKSWGCRIWDAGTGQVLAESRWQEGRITAAQFSLDGRELVTTSADTNAWVCRSWEVRSGQTLTGPVSYRHGGTTGLERFSPDGRQVLTTLWESNAFTCRIGDPRRVEPPEKVPQFRLDHGGLITKAEFSPDGERVLTIAWSSNTLFDVCRLWSVRTAKPLSGPLAHGLAVNSAQFSPDSRLVVTASEDNTARIWDARTGRGLTEPLEHEAPVEFAAFSCDGQRVVTFAKDRTFRIWDTRTGLPLTDALNTRVELNSQHPFIRDHQWAQFSPDGKRVLILPGNETIQVWEVPEAPSPVPRWFPELAEAVACKRLNSTQALELVSPEGLWHLKQTLLHSPAQDFYTRWAKWFLADPWKRAHSPFSSTTAPETK